MRIKSAIKVLREKYSSPIAGKPGLYCFDYNECGQHSRVHLRIEEDQTALLFINANRIVHLNSVATQMTWLFLNKVNNEEIVKVIQSRYDVSKEDAENDYAQLSQNIHNIIFNSEICPVHDLDLNIIPPFSLRTSAPYRMDLALTYRCNNDCAHCYNDRPRNFPELSTTQWFCILDKLWDVGIPHVVFTGGEPTLRNDLPELISHAQKLGQITGLNTNARRISDKSYLEILVNAGLDHVQITLESSIPKIHDYMVRVNGSWKQTVAGIENALNSPLYVMTNTTLLQENSPYLDETLEFLALLGVPTIGLNALIYSGKGTTVGSGLDEKDLPALLEIARDITTKNNQKLIWYTPTQYCNFDPMRLELGIKGCTAASYNMCIESDGSVLPCQSYYRSVGNILKDPWINIWNHPLCLQLRERKNIPQKCSNCALLNECGGGCPLSNGITSSR